MPLNQELEHQDILEAKIEADEALRILRLQQNPETLAIATDRILNLWGKMQGNIMLKLKEQLYDPDPKQKRLTLHGLDEIETQQEYVADEDPVTDELEIVGVRPVSLTFEEAVGYMRLLRIAYNLLRYGEVSPYAADADIGDGSIRPEILERHTTVTEE